MTPELLIHPAHHLGEGPLWDESRGCLWWVNIMAGEVHQLILDGGQHRKITLTKPVGTIGLSTGRHLVIAWETGFAWLDPDSGAVQPIANDQTTFPGIRFNEGKPGPDGGFWAGTMALEIKPGAGQLFHLSKELQIRSVVPNVTVSNGLAWTADRQTMYYIDTPTQQVVAYDFDASAGCISRPRAVIDIATDLGHPDGMTIDQEGMLWIAMWEGSALLRWDPSSGQLLETIPLPTARVTSCTFGGPNLQTLFITTAGGGAPNADEMAGALFSVDLPVGGFQPYRFEGQFPD